MDVETFCSLTASNQPIERLEEGTALYRGPFLEGFGLKDSPLFDEWQQRARDQLQRQCLSALERVSEHYQQSGNLEKAIVAALKQVDLAPWQEEAHRRLMRLLALNGQRSAALAQYETCRHLLQKELGVEVSPETILLYQHILNGEIAAQAETPGPYNSPTPLFTSPDLPTWQIPFVGRRGLLTEIQERLHDPACRLLTLLGSGGSGKTRLAAETAARQAQAFQDGVYFALLAVVQSGELIVPAVAKALGYKSSEGGDPQQQVLDYLRNKTLLLVLDNFEHLIAEATVVAEILRSAPRVKILVTSQVRLNLSGEHLVPVTGMNVPEQTPASVAEALQHSSFHLFMEGAQRIAPTFTPTLADIEQIQIICRLVQGSPLAILLAAAWMRLLSPAEIAAEIEAHSLDFLESEWQDVPERQRSLRAVFDYSWRLLSERERRILAGLAVFRGDFSYPAAQEVCGASLRDLMKLVNHSLLERNTAGRYQLHELVRQYGGEKLHTLPDQGQSLHDRHAVFYTAALKIWSEQLRGPSQLEAFADMDLEIDNIRAAWKWVVECRQYERLEEGWEGLIIYYFWRTYLAEGGLPFQQAADLFETEELTLHPMWFSLWAVFLAFECFFTRRLDLNIITEDRLSRSIKLLEMAANSGQDVRRYKAYVLWISGAVIVTGSIERKRLFSASEALFQEIDNRWGEAKLLLNLGAHAQYVGDYNEAVRCLEKSLTISRGLGVQMEIVETQRDLAAILSTIGQMEESDQLLRECVGLCRKHGDLMGLATGLLYLVDNFIKMGRYRDAFGWIEECISIYEKLGDKVQLARIIRSQGFAQLGLGEYGQAQANFQKSYSLFEETGMTWGMGGVKRNFGLLALVAGDFTMARVKLEESITILRKAGARSMFGQTLAALGIVELRLNEPGQARQRLAEALLITKELHDSVTAIFILPCAFLFLVQEGKIDLAQELYALASLYPFFTNTAFIQDLVREPFIALSNEVQPEVVAAAEQRGRQRDLWATIDELLVEFSGETH